MTKEEKRVRNKEYYIKNREKEQARGRESYWKDPEKRIEAMHKWRDKNPEIYRKAVARWSAANKEKVKEIKRSWEQTEKAKEAMRIRTRRYKKNNISKVKLATGLRRARKRRTDGGTISLDIVGILWKLQRGMCAYDFWCRNDLAEVGFHLDHVMPLALGGRHEDANLQLLCPSCNLSKGPKHPDEFVRILRERLADLGL